MAISANTTWEAWGASGNDLWGGGFDSTLSNSSVNYSYPSGNLPRMVIDNVGITATDVGIGATMTIAGYTTSSGDIGNVLNIVAGVNATPGRYQVISLNPGTNVWTLDRNWSTGAGIVTSGNFGGAFQTVDMVNILTVGQQFWVKNPSVVGSSINIPSLNSNVSTYILGYSSNRWDNNYCKLTLPSSGLFIYNTIRSLNIANFDIEPSSVISYSAGNFPAAIYSNGNVNSLVIFNIRINSNSWPNNIAGIVLTSNCVASNIEISGCNQFGLFASQIFRSNIHHCKIGISGICNIYDCFIHDNTSDGIVNPNSATTLSTVSDCTVHNNIGHGINMGAGSPNFILNNNIISNNSKFGITFTGTSTAASFLYDNNIYFSNTQGNRNGIDRAILPKFNNINDISLSASPYNLSPQLNNIMPSGGTLCHSRNTSLYQIPGTNLPGRYIDAGAFPSLYLVRSIGSNGGFS